MLAAGGQKSLSVAITARDTTSGKLGPVIAWSQIGAADAYTDENGVSAVV